jgi:hypothetical protein
MTPAQVLTAHYLSNDEMPTNLEADSARISGIKLGFGKLRRGETLAIKTSKGFAKQIRSKPQFEVPCAIL